MDGPRFNEGAAEAPPLICRCRTVCASPAAVNRISHLADQGTQPARFTAAEFGRLVSAGLFDDDRLELVEGELQRMAPPMGTHSTRQSTVFGTLWQLLGHRVVVKAGIEVADDGVLVCDIAVVTVPMTEHRFFHPEEVTTVIEIAETSADRDLTLKRGKYAAAGIGTYWVVDGRRSAVHIFSAPHDGDYTQLRLVPFGESLAVPGTDATIVID